MKQTIFAVMILATVTACSADTATQEAEGDATETTTSAATVLADLGGDPTGPIYTENAGETLALSGYDAVSYFTGDEPVAGSSEFTIKYEGYEYRFANAENAAEFQKEPAKYAPQYGGYCAWAIGANDALAPGDPNVYKIVDGKLYLNFNESVAERWNEDIPGFIAKGDTNYPTHDASEHYTAN